MERRQSLIAHLVQKKLEERQLGFTTIAAAMASFANKFAVLTEINDKKKTVVISDKPAKAKSQKKPASPKAEEPAAAAPKTAQAPATKGKAAAAQPATVVNKPPTNSLAALKAELKKAKEVVEPTKAAEAEAPKAEVDAEAPKPEGEVEGGAPVVVEGGAPLGEEAPVPEAPKLTMADYDKLRNEKRFVPEAKEIRKVDAAAFKSLVKLAQDDDEIKIAKPVAEAKKPASAGAASKKKVVAATVAPVKVVTKPKEKKPEALTLGEFSAQVQASRGGRGGRGGFRGARGPRSDVPPVVNEKSFPTL